jgi:hypothetical protein
MKQPARPIGKLQEFVNYDDTPARPLNPSRLIVNLHGDRAKPIFQVAGTIAASTDRCLKSKYFFIHRSPQRRVHVLAKIRAIIGIFTIRNPPMA